MTEPEAKIIALIEKNPYLSGELKKRYILALFLMDRKDQEEYLQVMRAFDYRCNAVERGMFVLQADQEQKLMKSVQEVKEDILRKIHSSH